MPSRIIVYANTNESFTIFQHRTDIFMYFSGTPHYKPTPHHLCKRFGFYFIVTVITTECDVKTLGLSVTRRATQKNINKLLAAKATEKEKENENLFSPFCFRRSTLVPPPSVHGRLSRFHPFHFPPLGLLVHELFTSHKSRLGL